MQLGWRKFSGCDVKGIEPIDRGSDDQKGTVHTCHAKAARTLEMRLRLCVAKRCVPTTVSGLVARHQILGVKEIPQPSQYELHSHGCHNEPMKRVTMAWGTSTET